MVSSFPLVKEMIAEDKTNYDEWFKNLSSRANEVADTLVALVIDTSETAQIFREAVKTNLVDDPTSYSSLGSIYNSDYPTLFLDNSKAPKTLLSALNVLYEKYSAQKSLLTSIMFISNEDNFQYSLASEFAQSLIFEYPLPVLVIVTGKHN